MNIIIFGGTGGLGKQLEQELRLRKLGSTITVGSKGCDVTDFKQCKDFFSSFAYERVYPDVVINLAGLNENSFIHKVDEKSVIDLNKVIDVTVKGSLNIASNCLPLMRDKGFGRLIFISSILSTKDVLGTGVYSACKAAVDRLVKNISAENISKRITCNSIQLGYFDGGMTYRLPNKDAIKESIGLKRWGRIDELANAVEFFIKTEYATGINLPLTGGL